MWFQKNKWKIIVPVLIAAVLAVAFFCGGDAPDAGQNTPAPAAVSAAPAASAAETADTPAAGTAAEPTPTGVPAATAEPEETAKPAAADAPKATETPAATPEPTAASEPTATPEPEKDAFLTDPVPEGKPLPVEPQDTEITKDTLTCTVSISCATILSNMDLCDAEKRELVPADGWILCPVEVTFYEGESVFNVLQRVCKQNRIHMEFENTPLYNSAYIEGIYNLYEFDVGELSGWMYKVNDWFPNYGCSRYQLQDGDVICWVYTCDLGYDVGGGYAVGE